MAWTILLLASLIRTGISATNVLGVHGGPGELELYAPKRLRDDIVAEHGVETVDGPLLMRWMPDDLWPVVRAGAPRAAVPVDLLEHDDPRVRRQASEALERL